MTSESSNPSTNSRNNCSSSRSSSLLPQLGIAVVFDVCCCHHFHPRALLLLLLPCCSPAPIITHVHGQVDVFDWADGYTEAWYLPAAANLAGFTPVRLLCSWAAGLLLGEGGRGGRAETGSPGGGGGLQPRSQPDK
jgi:hypothetical protein